MSTSDWSRLVRKGGGKNSPDKNSIPIRDVVAYYGGEVREGKNVSVKCCIHDDTRRSAVIDTYNNLYYCHTCGKGGSPVDVIMEKESLGFKDALQRATEIVTTGGHEIQRGTKRGNRKVSRRTWNL